MKLNERVTLLAGATGAVGGALARHLVQAGGRVGIAVRKPWQVEPVRGEFAGKGVLVGCVPTGDSEAAAGFVKGVADALGPIDAYVAATGSFAACRIGKDPAVQLQDLLDANLHAATGLARAALAPMRRRRAGRLVFVGAAAVGTAHAGGMANYLASKAALHEWVRALHCELAAEAAALRAAAILPGVIDTAANREAMPDADRSRWHPVAEVVGALAICAFGEPPGAGPLYPLPFAG
jgi:NAD(P)-dependent dehydrogenase (short-subunit alcohol dehydrogenase family)